MAPVVCQATQVSEIATASAPGAGIAGPPSTWIVAPRTYADLPPPIAGWLPGSGARALGPADLALAAGAVQGEQRAVEAGVGVADGEDADGGLGGRGRERERGDGERGGVECAQRAQDARPLGHRGVQPAAAGRGERDHRQRAADPEREPDGDADRRVADR